MANPALQSAQTSQLSQSSNAGLNTLQPYQTSQPAPSAPSIPPTQPMQSVRALLNQNGYSQIGYVPSRNMVQVNGQDFMQPQKNYNGTTFTDQPSFNQALSTYQKRQAQTQQPSTQTQVQSSTGSTQPSTGGTQQPTGGTDYNSLLAQLQGLQNQTPQDPYSTPEYAAAQAEQQRQQWLATRQLQESMGSSGFGRSTNLTDRIQQNQVDSQNYLNTTALPSIIQELQSQKQNQISNLSNLIGLVDTHQNNLFQQGISQAGVTGYYNPSGMTADQIKSLMATNSKAYSTADPTQQNDLHNKNLALAALLGEIYNPNTGAYSGGNPNGQVGTRTMAGQTFDQTAKDNAFSQMIAKSAQTGYMPYDQNAASIISKILADKQNYATDPNATADANKLRGELASLGVDSSPFGTNVTLSQAQKNLALGTRTLPGQTFDQTAQNDAFTQKQAAEKQAADIANNKIDTNIKLANLTLDQQKAAEVKLHDAIGDKLAQAKFDQDVKQNGLDYALKVAIENNTITNDAALRAIGWANADTSAKTLANTISNDAALRANDQQTQLMNDWRALGVAPAGITGVVAGTPYTGSSTQVTHATESKWATQFDALPAGQQVADVEKNKAEIIKELGSPAYNSMHAQYVAQSAKDSTNNLSSAISQLETQGITRAQALQYAQKVQSHLSSSDYKKLNSWIGTNLH